MTKETGSEAPEAPEKEKRCEIDGAKLTKNGKCRSCAIRLGRKKRTPSPPQGVGVDSPGPTQQPPGFFLDFKEHPDLLESLTEAGRKEFRTPEGQAMALIDQALNGKSETFLNIEKLDIDDQHIDRLIAKLSERVKNCDVTLKGIKENG